ncbi:SulP family inorganic anion transporter [Halomarina pelagica]|uniref:SulP family inorganic anion transporter n=1 Tax=Halomarina pelagica TaxID=2961599 RepID=UPI0020C4EF49|nr:SulP family inorganic anion transporter [Halomarina sp. BND7]
MATGVRTRLGRASVGELLPVTRWLPSYDRRWFDDDLLAGATVAAALLPESMAYATLANVPPEVGLYASLLAAVVYVFVGTSRQLIVGPTSALAVLVAAGVAPLAAGEPGRYVALVSLTALLVGVIALFARLFRLGFLVNFVSESVLLGFSAGAALYIASTQLGSLAGIEGGSGEFFERLWYVGAHLGAIHPPTLALGIGGVVLLALAERYAPYLPNALLLVSLSIVVTSAANLADRGVSVVGSIPSGLPTFGAPTADPATVEALLPLAAACFLLSYVEGIGVVETFAARHDDRSDPDQELVATGLANLASGLAGALPVGGSMTRSALNDGMGARTQLSGGIAALLLGVVLLFLTGAFSNLPNAVLAAIVVVAVGRLVDVRGIRRVYRVNPTEFPVVVAGFLGVLLFGMLAGVLVGVLVSALIVLGHAAYPHTAVLGRVPGTDLFADHERHPEYDPIEGVLVYRAGAELFYANAKTVERDLLATVDAAKTPPDLVVLDLSSSPTLDLTAADALARLWRRLDRRGVAFRIAEADGPVRDVLRAHGAGERLGPLGPNRTVAAVVDDWRRDR